MCNVPSRGFAGGGLQTRGHAHVLAAFWDACRGLHTWISLLCSSGGSMLCVCAAPGSPWGGGALQDWGFPRARRSFTKPSPGLNRCPWDAAGTRADIPAFIRTA